MAQPRKSLKTSTGMPAIAAAANQAAIVKAGLAADVAQHQHDKERVHGARASPICLLDKNDILAITGVTYPTIWAWMRAGKFPRGRVVGGKTMWLSSEIDAWMTALPRRPLKDDAPEGAMTNNEHCP